MVRFAGRSILLKTWCCVVFTCLFIGLTLFSLASYEWPDERQPLFNKIRRFSPEATIGEPVWVARSGLHRIDVALVRFGPASGQVTMRLTTDERGINEIAVTTVPAEAAENVSQKIRRPYGFVSFYFSPLENVADKEVWLWLEADSEMAGKVGARCLKVDDQEWHIAFKTHYQKSPQENLAVLITRLSANLGRPYSLFLYGGLLVIYGGLLGILCLYFRQRWTGSAR
jgi:hypothetical protein